MIYREPNSLINGEASLVSDFGKFVARYNLDVEVSFFDVGVWELEVRYDRKNHKVKSPIYTGDQDILGRANLAIEGNVFAKDNSKIKFLADGSFEIFENDQLIEAFEKPFSAHEEKIEIYEKIMALKVTDFSSRAPFAPKGDLYSTRMHRFQYARPEGVVLGLPGQTGEVNRNGYRFELYNSDHFIHTPDRHPLYQSWPILFHQNKAKTHWMAIFHDNPARTFVDIGDFYPDKTTFESITNNTRVYLAYGKTLDEVSKKISLLLGKPLFPPAWAFGYQQCRWSYMSSEEIRTVVSTLREKEIPCDSIYFDIDYMDHYKVFTFNPETFGDGAECIKEIDEKYGVKSICIVDPGVKIEADYRVYEELLTNGGFLKDENGLAFEPVVWPGKCLFPDFGDQNVKNWWAGLESQWLLDTGFVGVWNDMNEPSNFEGGNRVNAEAMTTRGKLKDEYNLFGYHMAKASFDGFIQAKGEDRPFVITRAGYPGVQKSSIIWHGDNHAWWEHLRLAIDTCLQYSLAGAYYTGPDVPGFTQNPSDDLAVRFFQLGAFLPLFRGHSVFFAKDKEPYAFSDGANKLIKEAIELRYSLLREWYTGFKISLEKREPLMRFIFDNKNQVVRDQFLLFDKLLVAPVTQRNQSKKLVYLPEGNWYRMGDNKNKIKGGDWIAIDVEDSTIPVYVKAGSVLVRNKIGRNVQETLSLDENIETYLDENGRAKGYWFNDDLKSNFDLKQELLVLEFDNGELKKTSY